MKSGAFNAYHLLPQANLTNLNLYYSTPVITLLCNTSDFSLPPHCCHLSCLEDRCSTHTHTHFRASLLALSPLSVWLFHSICSVFSLDTRETDRILQLLYSRKLERYFSAAFYPQSLFSPFETPLNMRNSVVYATLLSHLSFSRSLAC